jgi:hypothetical protein
LPPFRVQLRTTSASSADLALVVEFVHEAGGTDVSVFQSDGKPRVEFGLDVDDADVAASAAHRVRLCLTKATPLLVGGWIIAWIVAA